MPPSDSAPCTDEPTAYDVLSNATRRYALAVLGDTDEPMALADLAREIARQEASESGEGPDAERARRIRTSLYHVHVPKLQAAGMVEYDAERRIVTPRASSVPPGEPPDRREGRSDHVGSPPRVP